MIVNVHEEGMAMAMTDLITQPMGKRIDTKGRLLEEE
jgi:hypothetical protein